LKAIPTKRKKIGNKVKWRHNNDISLELLTFDKEQPDRLCGKIVLTIPSCNGDYTTWEWINLWRKPKKLAFKHLSTSLEITPDIFIYTFPEFKNGGNSGTIANKMSLTKSKVSFIVIDFAFDNNKADWKEFYIEKINQAADKMYLDIIDEVIDYENE